MKKMNKYIASATKGDAKALEQVVLEVKDEIYNLSLRMLGSVSDAQDASQDIIMKVITNLSSFREESNFHTWVYRISANYLFDYRKSMFAQCRIL